ncbi:hypothetical protein BOTBODRAFT_36542 [Botryobasidium botryosum FD-172 SS1]|uniref:Uncharacterized protein n=1 Tax=Botryobasidium botryosum (strain FD-172 SS1) TaxID=930990 RepID=A0A067MET9_BOTB1|nr:hypothetical protein BOTBODRAFT_36542 [Botryobasidium botryosum FD-172 SS1]
MPSYSFFCFQVAEELKQVPPLPSMPPCLFPTRLPLPPYIHCGLPITDAQIKQVLRDNHYRSPMRLFDEHGNIVPASPDEPVPAMDATAAAQYISERVGYPVDVRYVLNAPTDAILSFGDNYALYRKAKVLPTNEKLQELLKFLELPEIEKPKWYIACLDYDWSFSRFGYC